MRAEAIGYEAKAKPSEYRIGRRTDGSLIFVGPFQISAADFSGRLWRLRRPTCQRHCARAFKAVGGVGQQPELRMGALEPEGHWLQAELAAASDFGCSRRPLRATAAGDAGCEVETLLVTSACSTMSRNLSVWGFCQKSCCNQEDGVISNFKNIQSPDWGSLAWVSACFARARAASQGRDIIAKKACHSGTSAKTCLTSSAEGGDEEVLTTLVGQCSWHV